MPKTARWRESDLRRAIKVATAAGLNVQGVEIAPDGTVRVLTGDARVQDGPNPWDALLPGLKSLAAKATEESEAEAALQRWRANRPIIAAQRKAEAKEVLAAAASKLDRAALNQLYEGHPTRSLITIARVLGVSKHKLELAAQEGLLRRDQNSRSVVYTKAAVLEAIGQKQ